MNEPCPIARLRRQVFIINRPANSIYHIDLLNDGDCNMTSTSHSFLTSMRVLMCGTQPTLPPFFHQKQEKFRAKTQNRNKNHPWREAVTRDEIGYLILNSARGLVRRVCGANRDIVHIHTHSRQIRSHQVSLYSLYSSDAENDEELHVSTRVRQVLSTPYISSFLRVFLIPFT